MTAESKRMVLDKAPHPLAWLAGATGERRFYWKSRDGVVRAGAGVVAECVDLDPSAFVRTLAEVHGPEVWVFGGHAFDPEDDRPRGTEWGSFLPARWVLPAVTLEIVPGGKATLATHDAPAGAEPPFMSPPLWLGKGASASPEEAEWRHAVLEVLGHIEKGEADKVVLARRWSRKAAPALQWSLLDDVAHAHPTAFHFAFEAEDGSFFLGASPERLYRRRGRTIETEAVAGTRQRFGDERDAALAESLLASDKDRREHRHVVEAIETALGPLVEELQTNAASVVPAGWVQHIVQPMTGRLKDGVGDGDLLAALHPTPATSGAPRRVAQEIVRRNEPFDRGWFAGPIGFASLEETELAVGIRSGLCTRGTLHAYAGAGIVAGSDPAAEWREIQAKVSPFLGDDP